jgi:hypothetical protein
MAATSYEDVLSRIQSLSAEEQAQLLQDLPSLMRRQNAGKPGHSILELQGLGKDVWGEMDAQEYVDRERDSWGG